MGYRLTLLEIQKLAYFLQEAGEPLRLAFEKAHFGPYAANLNKVLERLDGHFIRGYGDSQKPDADIELLPGAIEEADRFLASTPEVQPRLERVMDLIDGLETLYGMELLSTMHWVAVKVVPPARTAEEAVTSVHARSERKRSMFRADPIRTGWDSLVSERWVAAA